VKAEEKPELGDRVRDTVTGFVGIYAGCTRWLTGCDRITIEPETLRDGKPGEMASFDETRIELVKKSVVKLKKLAAEVPVERAKGGPMPEPMRRRDPR